MKHDILNCKYDLIVSIGAACSCTETLRAKNLQIYSYPFDWLAGSNFINRVKIINNNFENWFNIEDLKFKGTRKYPMPCDIYLNTRTNILFNHDFPIFSPLEILYGEVKEKYDRRINRFLYQISNSKNVLFVYLERPDLKEDTSTEEIKEGYELLKNRFPSVDINILYLSNAREVDYKNRKIINISDNIVRIDFDYDGYDKKYPNVVNFEPLLKVFEDIEISDKFLNLSQRLLKRIKFIIKIKNNEHFTRVILFNLIRFKIWK